MVKKLIDYEIVLTSLVFELLFMNILTLSFDVLRVVIDVILAAA